MDALVKPQALPASWHDPDEWRWFALKIAPGREFIAERVLRDNGFDVFVPLAHKRNRRGFLALPRLRGYVFIGFCTPEIPWLDVLRFRRIVGVVSHDGRPIPLPAMQVHNLASWSQRPLRVGRLPRRGRRCRPNGKGDAAIINGPYAGRVVREIRCVERDRLNEREIAELYGGP